MRRTKIVCTLGPSTSTYEQILALARAGMDVARLNFSHGSHDQHARAIANVRRASAEVDRAVAILQDLSGPKIRIGELPPEGVELAPGAEFTLHLREGVGDASGVFVNCPTLPRDVGQGDSILLADGAFELEVLGSDAGEVRCRVVVGGRLTSHKGLNVPSASLSVAALTDKDREDLAFGLENDVDFVALSFVRKASEVEELRALVRGHGCDVPIIAKIEQHEVLDQLDEVLAAADGVMVARGDLGVEIPIERVPFVQKQLIHKANRAGKPVITATQMLRSMVASPRPTRAEVTDVANAILDGTDAVMLSEETAAGEYPVEAVRTMDRIARETEASSVFPYHREDLAAGNSTSDAISRAACQVARATGAAVIVTPTMSGTTARLVARHKPHQLILAPSMDPHTIHRLALTWGVRPLLIEELKNADGMFAMAAEVVKAAGLARPGERAVITAGLPVASRGTTNVLMVKEL